MGTPPKFQMMRLKSLNYIVRGSKASKGTHLRSRVWFWKCLVKDACKTSKLINSKINLGQRYNLRAFILMMAFRIIGINYTNQTKMMILPQELTSEDFHNIETQKMRSWHMRMRKMKWLELLQEKRKTGVWSHRSQDNSSQGERSQYQKLLRSLVQYLLKRDYCSHS